MTRLKPALDLLNFHTISKSQEKFQHRNKIFSVVLKLMRARVIPDVRRNMAIQPDLSSSISRLGIITILIMFDILLSLVVSET